MGVRLNDVRGMQDTLPPTSSQEDEDSSAPMRTEEQAYQAVHAPEQEVALMEVDVDAAPDFTDSDGQRLSGREDKKAALQNGMRMRQAELAFKGELGIGQLTGEMAIHTPITPDNRPRQEQETERS